MDFEKMIQVYDNEGYSGVFIYTITDKSPQSKDKRDGQERAKELKDRIIQNESLRKAIVDGADFHDGKETLIIGNAMRKVLLNLNITDVPEFYSKANLDSIMRKMEQKEL